MLELGLKGGEFAGDLLGVLLVVPKPGGAGLLFEIGNPRAQTFRVQCLGDHLVLCPGLCQSL